MVDHPTAGSSRHLRSTLRVAVSLVVIVASTVSGLALGEVLGSRSGPQVAATDDTSTQRTDIAEPVDVDLDEFDGESELTRVARTLEGRGLPGATWIDTRALGDDRDAPAAASSAAPLRGHQGSGDEALPVDPTALVDDPSAEGAGDEPHIPDRVDDRGDEAPGFEDPCAAGGAGDCPEGEAGTVRIHEEAGEAGEAGDDAEGDVESDTFASTHAGLEMQIHPYVSRVEYPTLRCDPGFTTRSNIPVVVTTNRPVHYLQLRLYDDSHGGPDGPVLLAGSELLTTGPDQIAGWGLGLVFGGRFEASLERGLHHCARFPQHLRGQLVFLEAAATDWLTGDRIVVKQWFHGLDHDALTSERPPVHLVPLDWNVLQVRAPYRSSFPTRGIHVGAIPVRDGAGDVQLRGRCIGAAIESSRHRPLNPVPYDGDAILSSEWPFDRSFDHQVVANLILEEGREHWVCVVHSASDPGVEYWRVGPPNQLRVRASLTYVRASERRRFSPVLPAGSLQVSFEGLPHCGSLPVPGRDIEMWRPTSSSSTSWWLGYHLYSPGERLPLCDTGASAFHPADGTMRVRVTRDVGTDSETSAVVEVAALPRHRGCFADRGTRGGTRVCPEGAAIRRIEFPKEPDPGLRGCGPRGCGPPPMLDTYLIEVRFELYDGPDETDGARWDAWTIRRPFEPRT